MLYCSVVVPSELVTEKDTVLFPMDRPLVPVIFEMVAPVSTSVVTRVIIDELELICTDPPFVVDVPLIVNTDKAVVLLT